MARLLHVLRRFTGPSGLSVVFDERYGRAVPGVPIDPARGAQVLAFLLDRGLLRRRNVHHPIVEGLTKTSTGETKFIDVQDFTHQGDVQLFEADVDKDGAKTIFKDDDENYSIIASSSIQHSPEDNKYYIGGFDEARLMNSTSGADDLNGDGDNEDVYVMIVFETTEGTESYWIVYLDLNGNGDISDDKPLQATKKSRMRLHLNIQAIFLRLRWV